MFIYWHYFLRTQLIWSPLKICFIDIYIALTFIRMSCSMSASRILNASHLSSFIFNQTYWRNETKLIQEDWFSRKPCWNNLIESICSSSGFLFFCCSSLVSLHCTCSSPARPGCPFEICLQYLTFVCFLSGYSKISWNICVTWSPIL